MSAQPGRAGNRSRRDPDLSTPCACVMQACCICVRTGRQADPCNRQGPEGRPLNFSPARKGWDTVTQHPGAPEARHYERPTILNMSGDETGAAPTALRSSRGLTPSPSPDFLHGAPPISACAAFVKESRMKCANASKVHRKSGSGLG